MPSSRLLHETSSFWRISGNHSFAQIYFNCEFNRIFFFYSISFVDIMFMYNANYLIKQTKKNDYFDNYTLLCEEITEDSILASP